MATDTALEDREFYFAAPEFVDVKAVINWSKPYSYEVLKSGLATEDETACLYSIIAYEDKAWWPYYFGMVYYQSISERQRQEDHKRRLQELNQLYPHLNFQIAMGDISFLQNQRYSPKVVQQLEGLLIYANWHDKMINKNKIESFSCKKSYFIRNTGFIDHLDAEEIAYGVLYRKND